LDMVLKSQNLPLGEVFDKKLGICSLLKLHGSQIANFQN